MRWYILPRRKKDAVFRDWSCVSCRRWRGETAESGNWAKGCKKRMREMKVLDSPSPRWYGLVSHILIMYGMAHSYSAQKNGRPQESRNWACRCPWHNVRSVVKHRAAQFVVVQAIERVLLVSFGARALW